MSDQHHRDTKVHKYNNAKSKMYPCLWSSGRMDSGSVRVNPK